MQEEPVEELLEVQDSIHGMPRSVGDFFTWGPVVREGPYWRAAEYGARKSMSRLGSLGLHAACPLSSKSTACSG